MSLYVKVGGVLVPTATVPGPQGTVGTQGPQGYPGDLTTRAIWAAATGAGNLYPSMLPSAQLWTLTGNLTVAFGTGQGVFPATQAGTITLSLKQAASGGPFSVTWPSTAVLPWPNGAAGPAMPTAASARLVVHLLWDGSAWQGIPAGVFGP